LSDFIRMELALAGFTEIIPLILCSHDENFAHLRKADSGQEAVILANPKTVEYQVVRTSLLPGVLKSIHHNRKHALPIKVFEVSDVVFKDVTQERCARNERHVCVAFCGKTSGFEVIHGILDRLMQMLAVPLLTGASATASQHKGYFIREAADNSTYFPGRCADIYLSAPKAPSAAEPQPHFTEIAPQDTQGPNVLQTVGTFGIVHPEVLKNFEISYPVSVLEFNLEPFL
ncbi:phenylalanine--tRNA ligase subunit beta, partial [Dimargaris verticillata]